MGPGKLFWKLFLGNALLMAAAMAVLLWTIIVLLDRSQSQELTEHLQTQAAVLRQCVADRFDKARGAELDRFVKTLAAQQANRLRYTLILPDGTVLADSEADPAAMESHASRAEVREALADGWGQDTRFSHTLSRDTRYVAVRVGPGTAPAGVVRVAMPVRTIIQRTRAAHRLIWAIGFAGLLTVVLLALGLARLWSRPIRRITLTARRLSRGDLSARVPVTGNDELAMLARSFNQMRDCLASHLEMIDRHRRTLESLVAQLGEGVVVAGPDGRIVLINPAAVRLLGLAPLQNSLGAFEGRAVEQCIPQHDLQKMLLPISPDTRLASGAGDAAAEAGSRDVPLHVQGPDGPVSLLARASDVALPAFSGARGERPESARPATGRLLVLTDVTELSRVIQVKTDFAANASHELRTPLAAIRAAVETLMQMDLTRDAGSAKGFLGVIDRHSERMQAMVADLLDLSRIESTPRQFAPETIAIRDLFKDIRARFDDPIAQRQLRWQEEVAEPLVSIRANSYLLRLALDNLVDNAIKFTDPGGQVRIACRQIEAGPCEAPQIAVEVADTGCGIPEAEQGRVFERFYQVERARTGGIRGTGLGLSIVRHAVAAMRGTVRLESRPGHGTRITILIPQ
ncbi:MAG: ATP-binding protein [Phycisphaerae bacterium]